MSLVPIGPTRARFTFSAYFFPLLPDVGTGSLPGSA
jgi:hypothetical protein